MDSLIGILSLCVLFLILILIMAILIVLHFKSWSEKRDEYYNDQMKAMRENVAEIKDKILDVLNHLK